jgi:ribonuclease R
MLLANETVAQVLVERDVPAVFRDHGPPDEAKLDRFATMCAQLDLQFEVEDALDPKLLSAMLKKIAAHPQKQVLHMLLLRAMKQAVYDVVNVGHFGLASAEYLHFTSPIRRYPDLLVHRLLKHHLRREGEPAGGGAPPPPPRGALAQLALESSGHERRAQQAEREVVDMYRALFMRDRVGEVLEGTVSAVTSFGVFVEIAEPFVEGRIKLDALGGDSWEFDETRMLLRGRRSGQMIRLGDPVKVRIDNVSVGRRQISLSLADRVESAEPAARPRRGQWGGSRRKRKQ